MALTPSTTLVSLTAFRRLDREFVVDSDSTELDVLTTHQDEGQHQLSEEITISHQQAGLTWVGGVFLFDEADHQTLWIDQPPTRSQIRFDPRVDASGWFSVNLDIFRGSEPDVSQSYHNPRFT
jgi:hypothetical protein